MRRSNLTHFALVLLLSVSNAVAQITDTQSGTDFADSVTGKMPALTKPTGFGAFDTPPATSAYTAANAKGSLGSLGSAAMQRCANYVPTGDPVKDQECAGVNYMANNCLQPNASQRQIIAGTANAYSGSNNCKGSYGSGAGAFDLSSQDKSMITNFGTATAGTAPQSCRTVTKIVSPAVTETYSCTKSTSYTESTCTQDLVPACVSTPETFSGGGSSSVYIPDVSKVTSASVTLNLLLNSTGFFVNGQVVVGLNMSGPGPFSRSSPSQGITNFWDQFVDTWIPAGCDTDYCYDAYMGRKRNPNFVYYQNGGNNSARTNVGSWDIKQFLSNGTNSFSYNTGPYAQAIYTVNVSWSTLSCTITWTDNCQPYEKAAGSYLSTPK